MQRLFTTFDNWSGGVATNPRPDLIPANYSPRGRNSQLMHIGSGLAVPAKRPGSTMMNTTTQAAIILGQYQYRRFSGGGFSTQHLVVTSTGKLRKMNATTGVITEASSTATPFTTGNHYPDHAVANNLIFFVNGQENIKFDGTEVYDVGIETPPSPPTVADNGAGGNPDGTYEFVLTFYNSDTGAESSRSAIGTVTVVTNKINVSWVAPVDPQVDFVRVGIRKGTINNQFFRLISGVTPAVDSTTGGFPVSTTSIVVDVTNAQLNAFLNITPSESENNPPPVLDRICFHQGRLFGIAVSDPTTLLFSKASNDETGGGVESWNPAYSIPVNVKDGDRIIAIHSTNEMLLIFKSRSIWILVGTFPNWQLRLLTNAFGCTSHRSIFTHAETTYFYSSYGPAALNIGDVPQLLAQPNMSNVVDQSNLNFGLLDKVCVGFDEQNLRLMWALPENTSGDRNTIILPYSLKLKAFESNEWNPMDVASMGMVIDDNSKPQLYFGDYGGRIFKFNSSVFTDGVPSGTLSGTITSAAAGTLVDSTAAFYTTGVGLEQLYVYARNASGGGIQRRRIASNTATTLTLASNWDTIPNSTYTYEIAGPDFEWDSRWEDNQLPFTYKRYEFLFIDIIPFSDTNSTVYIDMFVDLLTTQDDARTFSISTTSGGAEWDVSLWDVGVFGGSLEIQSTKIRLAKVGKKIMFRFRNGKSGIPIILLKQGIQAQQLTTKR